MSVVRLTDVDEGQHHEDEDLQRDDQDVEDRPAQTEDEGKAHPADARRVARGRGEPRARGGFVVDPRRDGPRIDPRAISLTLFTKATR